MRSLSYTLWSELTSYKRYPSYLCADDSDWVADDYEDVKEAAPDAQVMSAQTSSVRKR